MRSPSLEVWQAIVSGEYLPTSFLAVFLPTPTGNLPSVCIVQPVNEWHTVNTIVERDGDLHQAAIA